MDAVQALAILSFGAFVTVAITAVTYMLAVRPRLLEPETPLEAQSFSDTVHQELTEQRLIIDKMNTTLTRHTAELSANASGSAAGPGLDSMRSVLDTQFAAVRKIGSMLLEQAERLSAMDGRIAEQGERLVALEAGLTASAAQPDPAQEHLLALIQSEADQLAEISGRLLAWNQMSQEQAAKQSDTLHQIEVMNSQITAQADVIRQLEERMAARLETLAQPMSDGDAQAERLSEISGRLLSAWNQMHQEQVTRQSDVLRMVEGLNTQFAAQSDVIQQLEDRVASRLESIVQPAAGDETQSAELAEISGQLLAWQAMSQDQVAKQSDVLRMVEGLNTQFAAQSDVIQQLEDRVASRLESIVQPAAGDETQSAKLAEISGQLSAWHEMNEQQVTKQSDVLRMVEGLNTQIAAQADVIRQLEDRVASRLESLAQPVAGDETQSAKLAEISEQLQAWQAMSQDQVAKQSNVLLRMVEGLNAQFAAQADVIQQLEDRVASRLESLAQPAATVEEAQASLFEKLQGQIGEILANLPRSEHPLGPGQDRLTDIEGIGPVYSGKLYKAGITTFEQLAAKTPDELTAVIGVPEWRARSIDTQSWIDQARHLAALREKVETDQ